MAKTIAQVSEAFVQQGKPCHGSQASNGYYRVGFYPDDPSRFYSYRTEIAFRVENPAGLNGHPLEFHLSLKRWSVSTGNHLRNLERVLRSRGYVPTGETVDHLVRWPGRYYGAGLAWHPTSHDTLPFEVWRKSTGRDPRQTLGNISSL